jgi:hypothetical protein
MKQIVKRKYKIELQISNPSKKRKKTNLAEVMH